MIAKEDEVATYKMLRSDKARLKGHQEPGESSAEFTRRLALILDDSDIPKKQLVSVRVEIDKQTRLLLKKLSRETGRTMLELIFLSLEIADESSAKMIGEFSRLAKSRKKFWDIADRNYERSESRNFQTLPELLSQVRFPKVAATDELVFLEKDSDPWHAELFEFSRRIYPRKNSSDDSLHLRTALEGHDFRDFHLARGELSRFFNRWAKAETRGIELAHIVRLFPSEASLVKLLVYLEVAYYEWIKDDKKKTGLFELSSFWKKKESL